MRVAGEDRIRVVGIGGLGKPGCVSGRGQDPAAETGNMHKCDRDQPRSGGWVAEVTVDSPPGVI